MIGLINNKIVDDVNINEWRSSGKAYEVIRVIEGKPLFLTEHLLRLGKLAEDIDMDKLRNSIKLLIDEVDKNISQNIFLSYNLETQDTMITFVKSFYPPKEWFIEGVDLGLLEIRRDNPNLKIYDDDYKKNVDEYLKENNFYETLIAHDGYITEGSRSNVFFIKNEKIITPPVNKVLPGITREKVFINLSDLGLKIEERDIEISEINNFDGVFITGTSIDILPVRSILNNEFDTCQNNIYRKIYEGYENNKIKDLKSYA